MGVRRWSPVLVVVALAGVLTVGSYLSKTPCSGPPYSDVGWSENMRDSYRLLCLTDIQDLWAARGLNEDRFPYVDGRLDPGEGPPGVLVDGALEYPVLTGLVMWLAALPADNSGQFLFWTAFLLLPVALLVAWQLSTLVGWRALIWAAAPALVFYSVYNWDLLPVAWTLGAVLAWRRRRYPLAGLCLGLGAATKIYPGFFVLPMMIERWVAGDRRGAVTVGGTAAGAWLAVNAPFLLSNFDGWWATYAFQADRVADLSTNSIYFWGFPSWTPDQVDRVSITLIAGCWVVALVLGFVFRPEPKVYPWLQVSAALLFSFLAFNKVYSPQYFLWVLPFLALLALRWGWWVGYWCLDVVLFTGLLRWYHDMGDDLTRQMALIGGWGKTVMLMLLFFAVLRTPLAFGQIPSPEPVPSPEPDHQPEPDPQAGAQRQRLVYDGPSA